MLRIKININCYSLLVIKHIKSKVTVFFKV